MTLEEWAEEPGQSVFDVECWTVARAFNPTRHHQEGYVVFSNPIPYRVWWFRTVAGVARWMKRKPGEVRGRVYSDTDWMRESTQAS